MSFFTIKIVTELWTKSFDCCPLTVEIFKHNFKFQLINVLINVKLSSKIWRFPFADISTDSYPESLFLSHKVTESQSYKKLTSLSLCVFMSFIINGRSSDLLLTFGVFPSFWGKRK